MPEIEQAGALEANTLPLPRVPLTCGTRGEKL